MNVEQKWRTNARPGPYTLTEQKNSDELIFEYVHNPNLDMYQVCQYIYIYNRPTLQSDE